MHFLCDSENGISLAVKGVREFVAQVRSSIPGKGGQENFSPSQLTGHPFHHAFLTVR